MATFNIKTIDSKINWMNFETQSGYSSYHVQRLEFDFNSKRVNV